MKYLNYFKYLFRHKWYVGRECFSYGLYFQGIIHDWSKFLPSEFIAYSSYLENREITEEFDLAILHHHRHNKHHWQYWILFRDDGKTIILPMPVRYVLEMISDWSGAGKAKGHNQKNEVSKWYNKNKKNIKLHPITRNLVETII